MIRGISKYLSYIFKTKTVWWYTASAKTRARYIRTYLGSLWLGISNLLLVGVLGFVYGVVFKAENFKDYYIYLGLGFSIWNTIGGSINAAPNIFTNNSSNLMNTNINPLFFVLEEWCFEIQTFLQSIGMVNNFHLLGTINNLFISCKVYRYLSTGTNSNPIDFSNVTHSLSREKSWEVVFYC